MTFKIIVDIVVALLFSVIAHNQFVIVQGATLLEHSLFGGWFTTLSLAASGSRTASSIRLISLWSPLFSLTTTT